MLHSNLELIRHINDECEFILKYTSDIDFEIFYKNDVLKKAIERSLEIIGEASTKINDEFKSEHPEITWKELKATRNIIIHNYTGVDYEIVWEIVKNDMPELEFQIKQILNSYDKKNS